MALQNQRKANVSYFLFVSLEISLIRRTVQPLSKLTFSFSSSYYMLCFLLMDFLDKLLYCFWITLLDVFVLVSASVSKVLTSFVCVF